MRGVLALCAAAPGDDRLGEALRVMVGLVAAGCQLTWLVVDRGAELLEDAVVLPPEAESYVEALAEAGVRARAASAAEVLAALGSHGDLLRLAPRDRAGRPAVLRVDAAWLARAGGREEERLHELLAAGQVLRA